MRNLLILLILIFAFIHTGLSQNSNVYKVSNTLSGTVVLTGEGGVTFGQTDYAEMKLDYIGKGSVEYFLDTNTKAIFGFKAYGAAGFVGGKMLTYTPMELRTAFHLVGAGISLMYPANNVIYPYASFGISHMWVYPRDINNVNFKSMFKILTFNGEVGARFMVSDRFSVNITGGAITGFDDGNEDNLDGNIKGSHKDWIGTCTFGFSYYIGKVKDSDDDGINDPMDVCPETPIGITVDDFGCPIDSDNDGVADYLDQCANTPAGAKVDERGCPYDSDGDNVPDYLDKCINTPLGIAVDSKGCPLDNDEDGVPDYLDKCFNTPLGIAVDSKGCPLDNDGDGVPDYLDKCPNTPKKREVDVNGCTIKKEIKTEVMSGDANFEYNEAILQPGSYTKLDQVAATLRNNSDYYAKILGYTDNIGSIQSNLLLSKRRAQAVADYLFSRGVARSKMKIVPMGEANPVVSNRTAAGRAINRRVEIKISQH
jgi:outer membrane protein OmpA-like peptidoglycan-associated protein